MSERADRLAIGGIVAFGAALRFSTLDVQSYWADEGSTVELVRGGLVHAVREAANSEATPPLYDVVAWAWSLVFGTSEVGLRSLSALLGTAAIVVVYITGRRLASARVGLGAAAVVAVSPMFVWYSQEARAYALLALLIALGFLFFAEGMRSSSGRPLVLWAVTSVLAALTHWFAVFVVAAEALWMLLNAFDRRPVRLAVIATGAGMAALAPLALYQLARTDREAAGSQIGRFPRVPGQLVIGYGVSPLKVVLGIAAAVLLIATLWLAYRRTAGAERTLAAMASAVAAVAAVTAIVLAMGGANFVNASHLHLILVPLALVIGTGIGAARASPAGPLVGVALCAVLAAAAIDVYFDPELQRVDSRAAAHALGPPRQGRLIVFSDDPRGLDPYLAGIDTLPERGRARRVDEIDLVALSAPLGSERSLPGVERPIGAPAPGFTLTEVRERPTYNLVRFRSPVPRLVTPQEILDAGVTTEPVVVYQRPKR
jgi:mannosyltransferase